jgi:hypothetical protein
MKSRSAIAQYEATVVLVVISLALASVVYTGLRRESSLDPQPVFVNEETAIGGTPTIERVEMNSSTATTVSSLSLDSANSESGVLAFGGGAYSTTQSLCAAGATTFFSVLAPQAGTLEVATNGAAWVSGTWGDAVKVTSGWQEVMIGGATTCTITLPGGASIPGRWNQSSALLSSIPVQGPPTGTAFTVYVPTGGGSHSLLITTTGGLDDVSV